MGYYPYPVQEVLTKAFGNDPIWKMRKPHGSVHDLANADMRIPWRWYYADQQAVNPCLEDWYLPDTAWTDDYIAYVIQKQDMRYASLLFMLIGEEAPFQMDLAYAREILFEWEAKGLEPRSFLSSKPMIKLWDDHGWRTGKCLGAVLRGTKTDDSAGRIGLCRFRDRMICCEAAGTCEDC